MAKEHNLTPPKPSTGDTVHLVVSGILSLIPGAPELFQKFISPPLEKRQYAWMQEVANKIESLETNTGLSLEELSNNEAFASVVLQATYVAIRNHHQEKRSSLANCVYNAGVATDIEIDLQLSFVRFIDELSPSHVVLLREINTQHKIIASMKSYESLYLLLWNQLTNKPSHDIFKMMCLELQGRGLIRISQDIDEFDGIYEASAILAEQTNDDLPRVIISEVGQKFLEFISSDE